LGSTRAQCGIVLAARHTSFKRQGQAQTAFACTVCSAGCAAAAAAAAAAVLVLKLVICPLAALGLLKLLRHIEAPFAHKVPVAPLASIIEMGLKMASQST
jgi:hypothetical protein